LLDVAALLKNAKGDRDVIIAIFDAEEPPHFLQGTMGSINFYNRQRRESVGCAFIMDLVGHDVPLPGLEDLLFVTGIESHPDVESIIQSVGFHEAVRIIPTLNDYVGDMSDHHVFRTNGVPYLFLSCGRWEHYHMSTDTPDKLNYTKMRGVADVLFLWVRMIDAKRLESGVHGHDPLQTELRFMNAALGPLLDKMRMSSLSSRKDMNKLVATLLDRFRL
jgi:Zn-dependent M28 family amino/carboxypeptidase